MNFEFATATRIVFGPGSISQLEMIAKGLGAKPLLVTGGNPARVPKQAALISAAVLNVAGEPTFDLARAGVAKARAAGCDSVIAIGGGSVIDAGKAVAMLLANGDDPLDYAEVIGAGKPITKPSLPFIAIPTTAGAGAEVTRNAVLTSTEHKLKVSLRSPFMLPTVALVDPALTLDLPPAITAATGMDALAQLIEPFVSIRANPMTDALCREGIILVARSIRTAYTDGKNLAARTDMALGALLGGMALANAGLGAVHGFAAPIGGMFNAPHGAICAALLAPVMEANAARVSQPDRFVEIARLLTASPDATIADGVAWLRHLTRDLSIHPLGRYGIDESTIPMLVEKASAASSMKANPVVLTPDELAAILRAAI